MEQESHDTIFYQQMFTMIHQQAMETCYEDVPNHPYLVTMYELIDNCQQGLTLGEASAFLELDPFDPTHKAIIHVAGVFLDGSSI